MNFAQWVFETKPDKEIRGTFEFSQSAPCQGGNTGLYFDKFVEYQTLKKTPKYQPAIFSITSSSIAWANKFCGPVGDISELTAYASRIDALVTRMGGDCRRYALPAWGYFVTGLGIEHPIENGFAWHRTLGVPYLPGSGVKGMALAWTRDWLKLNDEQRRRIFGFGADDTDTGAMGSVTFLDAVPIEPPTLSAEILNPHGPGSGAPEEAGETTPIGFLAVKEATFQFSVVPSTTVENRAPTAGDERLQAAEQAKHDCQTALDCIGDALATIGAGAKTKSGYGRFTAAAKC